MITIKRPLLTILIGAIIGIIYGLYLETSIAITIIFLSLLLFYILKNRSKFFYFILKRRKIILVFLISIIFSIIYLIFVNIKYQKIYNETPKNVKTYATVVSEPKETEYYYSYEVKVQDKKFLMYVKKNSLAKIEYGAQILLEGEYIEPQEARNYKGFNYKEYLKTKKIYGSFKAEKYTIIKENNVNIFIQYSNKIRNKIIEVTKEILSDETEGLMIGILIGENTEISEEITENFSKSSLSHIVAISGSHITYIVIGLSFILTKSKIPKKGIYIITIIGLIFFMFITRFSTTVVRACVMGIIMLFSKIAYRKLDVLNSIAVSMLIILLDNPFAINDIGLQLSYLGTLGIVFLNLPILKFLKKYINEKLAEILSVTLSAQIAVLPITIINFNTISTVFIISNLLAIPISGIITIYGYANVFLGMAFIELGKIFGKILNLLTNLLIWIAEITAKVPFASVVVTTPNIISVTVYYVLLWSIWKKKYRKIVVCVCLVIWIICNILIIIPQNLTIHFIDVGQRRQHVNNNADKKNNFNRYR